MNTINYFSKHILLTSSIVLGLGVSPTLAANFRSTYTFPDARIPAINTVIVNFSTDVMSGIIDETDLTNWSVELLNGTTSVFLDEVIIGGTVQPIGGVNRILSEIMFDFNLDTLEYIALADNDVPIVQTGSTGVTYNILNGENLVGWGRNVDGIRDPNGTTGSGISQFDLITEKIDDPVTTPEPTTILGLLAFSSVGLLARKRK